MDFELVSMTRHKDGNPRILLSAVVPPALRTNHPFLACSEIAYTAMPNGFMNSAELNRVRKWERLIEKELASCNPILAGHITEGGTVTSYFYLQKQGPSSITIKTGLLKKSVIELKNSEDSQWSTYQSLLEPTALEYESQRNIPLLKHIQKFGDNPLLPREVDFSAYFTNQNDRELFIAEMLSQGYHLTKEGCWEGDDGDYWVNLGRIMTLEADVIHPATEAMNLAATHHNGEYDGWSTPRGKKQD